MMEICGSCKNDYDKDEFKKAYATNRLYTLALSMLIAGKMIGSDKKEILDDETMHQVIDETDLLLNDLMKDSRVERLIYSGTGVIRHADSDSALNSAFEDAKLIVKRVLSKMKAGDKKQLQ